MRRSVFRRRVLPCLLVLVLLPLLAGAVFWLRTPGGQDWLRQEVGTLLAPPLAEQGLSLELIRLEGALPLEVEGALRLHDADGLWLDVPRARVDVGLSVFPPRISLDLRLERPSLYRLPQLPPSPDEPSPPLAETLAGVEAGLRSTLETMADLPGWLPSLHVRDVALEGLWLGSAVLDGSSSGTMADASGQAAQDAAAPAGTGSASADGQTLPAPAAASAPAQEATTPGATPAPPLSVAVAAAESALRVGEGLEVSLCLTAEADFSLSGTTAQAGLQASWQLASASAAGARNAEATPPAAASAPELDVAATGTAPAAPQAQESGAAPSEKKNTDALPLLTEAAGRWLPAPLALLLTPGQASSLRVELALRPGERPALALETLQADAGAVRLRGKGTLELTTAADVLASPLTLDCSLALASAADAAALLPQARALLAPLGDALRLDIGVQGSPGAPEPRLELACATLDLGGHAVNDISLLAGGEPLPWPQLTAGGKVGLPLSLQVRTGQDHISASLRLLAGRDGTAWQLGLPQLELHGAGARLAGSLLALLPDAPQEAPVAPPAPAEAQAPVIAAGDAGAAAAAVPPAPAIVGSDFVPARLLARLFPDPGSRPRLWTSLYGEIEDWAALGRVLDYWSPGLRLEKKDGQPVRLMLRAGGLSCAPDSPEELPLAAVAGLADPAFLNSADWRQWFSLDADVGFLRLHGRGGERLLRELHQHLRIDDIFGQGKLEQRLDVRQLHVAGMRLERVLVGLNGELATPLEAELACAGDVRAKVRLRWQGDRLDIPVCDLHLKQGVGLRLQAGTALVLDKDGLSLRGLDARIAPAGRIRATASLKPAAMDMRLSLDSMDLAPWRAVVPGLPSAALAFQSRLYGSPAAPAGTFRLDVRRLEIPQSSLPPLDLALTGKLGGSNGKGRLDTRLELPPSTRQALGAEQAGLEARLPLRFSANGLPLPDMTAPLSGRLDWQGELAPLWRLVPVADRRVTGRLDMHLALAGSLAVPTAKGRLEVAGGRYEDLALGILLTDIKASVTAGSGKGLKLEPVRVEASMSDGRGGLVTAAGSLHPEGGRLDLDAAMKRLRPLRRADIQATLSGTASVKGTLMAPQVTADITIDEARVNLNRLTGSSVTTLPVEGTSEAPEPVAEKKEGLGSLDVSIRAPGHIAVNGHGLESEWQAGLRVRGALNDPLVIGSVRSVRGQFDLLSKLFTLRPSTISFNGGAVSNPLLDVTLRYEVPEITADVRVSGSVRRMKLDLSSTPSLPQEEIISRVMFGRGSSELGRFESLRLAAAVARLAGFGSGGLGVLDLGRAVLGVDVLRINSATDKESGDEESSLEVGKFIGEKIYLGVEQGLEPDSTAVIMELELTPHSKAGIRTEQDNTSAGIQWKMNY
ncbi:MAG: translocation/assembly module TamB domain-containing protein [Desulfovibrio piger]|uniref:translocation/assembly module TamB domain-containing protein n=1 Tax=Desulfovibrio piger TaxID=901 RepID=UPI002A828344|nr:translocation/assembly module TamB domain-containing protein [Desulfovibrio piger]MDY3880914.1 translocation/assembly module TamB domain-containing protein [Desulfovibrio piger]